MHFLKKYIVKYCTLWNFREMSWMDSSTAHVPDLITGTIVVVMNAQTRLIINGPGFFSRQFCLIEHPKLYMHIIWAFHDILSALRSGIFKPTLWTFTTAASHILTVPIIGASGFCSHRLLNSRGADMHQPVITRQQSSSHHSQIILATLLCSQS